MSNKPHKHAEVIKAWADGAEIEFRSLGGGTWQKASTPTWTNTTEYRVKPPEVLLEDVPLEVGQKIYYCGLNQNAPVERIVTDFHIALVRTQDSRGEDQGFNCLQFFTRQAPKVSDTEIEHAPLTGLIPGKRFYYVYLAAEKGFMEGYAMYRQAPEWLETLFERGLVFSTQEGARQKFQKILKGLKE